MDAFDDWVKAAKQHACFRQWGDKLVALGASWDSFRRDKREITEDLVQGGIPTLAARDIVDIASKEVKRTTSPMAIFWDLENTSIPADVSGRDIVCSLKTVMSPHGELRQFRGYASIGLNLIPQEKRSDLQLAGCHLVDCPHSGRKEVADKMIIVDAMQFAYQHPEGATLCFITGDMDYAYLLAVLQRHPEWRTIVVSRGTMQSMLHVNCDTIMCWETDILQPIYASAMAVSMNMDDKMTDRQTSNHPKPLKANKLREEDVELLHSVMIQEGRRFNTNSPRKSQVGNTLRQMSPARFPTRDTIKAFFSQVVEKGIITEHGEGAFKTLMLSERLYASSSRSAWLIPSESSPLPILDWPPKALEMAKQNLPFVLFIEKIHFPPGSQTPRLAFIQPTGNWLLLMYASNRDVIISATDCPWLRKGTLVNWKEIAKGPSSEQAEEAMKEAAQQGQDEISADRDEEIGQGWTGGSCETLDLRILESEVKVGVETRSSSSSSSSSSVDLGSLVVRSKRT